MLVVETEEEERSFIILDMKRLYHKMIEEVDTWWAFNSKQIILREAKFDFDVGGLQEKIKEKASELQEGSKERTTYHSDFLMISYIGVSKSFASMIARRQTKLEAKVHI